jgi:hypothetical protein
MHGWGRVLPVGRADIDFQGFLVVGEHSVVDPELISVPDADPELKVLAPNLELDLNFHRI